MTIEPSWSLNESQPRGAMPSRLAEERRWLANLKQSGVLVPDTRLQAIVAAWKLYRELHRIDPSSNETADAWELAIALLDALTKEDSDG